LEKAKLLKAADEAKALQKKKDMEKKVCASKILYFFECKTERNFPFPASIFPIPPSSQN